MMADRCAASSADVDDEDVGDCVNDAALLPFRADVCIFRRGSSFGKNLVGVW